MRTSQRRSSSTAIFDLLDHLLDIAGRRIQSEKLGESGLRSLFFKEGTRHGAADPLSFGDSFALRGLPDLEIQGLRNKDLQAVTHMSLLIQASLGVKFREGSRELGSPETRVPIP